MNTPTIRYFKQGTKCIALLTLDTSTGPISLAASADEATIARVLAQSKQAMFGTSYIIVDEGTTRRAAELAQQIAKEGLMGKLATVTAQDKAAAAGRLYIRLTQKDATAWNAVRQLVAQAKAGNPKAAFAWKLLLQAHAKATNPRLGTGSGTLDQQRAASRIYDRLQQGDAAAWQDLTDLAQNAENGDAKSIQAWSILASVHEGRTRGMTIGAGTLAIRPHATAQQLTRMAEAALASKPQQLSGYRMGVGAWKPVAPKPGFRPASTSSILLESPNVGYRFAGQPRVGYRFAGQPRG